MNSTATAFLAVGSCSSETNQFVRLGLVEGLPASCGAPLVSLRRASTGLESSNSLETRLLQVLVRLNNADDDERFIGVRSRRREATGRAHMWLLVAAALTDSSVHTGTGAQRRNGFKRSVKSFSRGWGRSMNYGAPALEPEL